MNEWNIIYDWVNEWLLMNEWVNEWINEWMKVSQQKNYQKKRKMIIEFLWFW